jgi:large subunit ribosomal protein L23
MSNPYAIIRTVLVTEKATELADDHNKYVFKVDPKADKRAIRGAVEAIFDGVKVASVNVMNIRGKPKRLRSARYGRRSDWRKAVVTLSEGSIEVL